MGFDGPHSFLSNFWPVDIVYEGFTYPTLEHAYQAAKTWDGLARAQVRRAGSPAEAKRLGHAVMLRDDWEQVKETVMLQLLRHKFHEQDLGPQLLATVGRVLWEVNDWGDVYWGVVRRDSGLVGKNRLGALLMSVRRELLVEWAARP